MNRTLILLSVTIGCALSHAEATLLHPTEAYCAAYEVLGVTKGGFSIFQRAYGHERFEKWNARPGFGPFRKDDTRYVIHKHAYIFTYDGKRDTKVKNPVFDTLVSSMAEASPETVQAVFMQAMQYESTGEVQTVNGIDCTVSRSVTMGRVCLASEGILAEQEVVGKVQRITSLEPGVSVDEATYDPEVWPQTITEAPDIGNALKALRGLKSPEVERGLTSPYTAPMEEDQQQNQTQAARTPQDNALGDAIDALRSTLTEDSGSDGWRRDIAIVGIVAALFGIVAWYALVTSRSTPVVADMVIHTQLTEASVWVDAAFEQVFAAYMQAGNRVRLRGEATVVGGGVSMISAFSAPRSHAGARRRIDITLADDGDSTTLLAILEVTESDGTQLGKAVLRGQPDTLSDLAARTALQVFDWLHIDPFSTGEQQSADTELPQTSDGTEPYARGVQALRRGEGAEAVRYLRRALELEPGHPMVNAMLAEALDFLGYQKQALQHIKIAFDRRRGLSREKQLMIEARLHYLNHHWRDAQTQYAALNAFYPEELSYGLALASVQTEGNQLIAAYETLTNLRSSPFFAQDPLIDIVEAKIRRREGAWESGLAAAERAIEKAIRLDLRGVLARALVVAADLGSENADRYLDQADELMREMDDPFGRSQVLREKGDRLRSAGDLDASSQLYTAAMDLSLEAGNESEVDAARQALAIVRDLTGDLESGYELKCQVFASYQRREVQAGAAIMLENMGISLFKLGRLDEASERFSQALEQFQKYGDQIGVAWWPYHQGRIDFVAGRFASARTRFLEAEANAIEHPEGEFALHVRFETLRLNLFTGLDDVGQDLHDLVRAYEKKGLLLDAGESLVLLARYKARRGKRQEALEHIDRAEAIFRTSGAMDYLAQTLTQRVRLGDIGNCDALRGVLEGMQHQPTLLLGGIALSKCGENKVDRGVLQQQAERLGLFEPRLASLALIDPEAARRLAGQRGGIAQDYLSLP